MGPGSPDGGEPWESTGSRRPTVHRASSGPDTSLMSGAALPGGRTQGSLAPPPRYLRCEPPVSGRCFLLDPLGLPPPLTASPPQSRTGRSDSCGASCGATGTGRTIGHGDGGPSSAMERLRPGLLSNLPGQRRAGFPAPERDVRRRSDRRSDSSRSRSSEPSSTCDMASANKWWPAWSAISRCISWATQRYAG